MRSHAHAHVIRARLPLPREKERVQATQMPRAPFAPSPCAAMTPISPRARRPPLRRLRIERPRRNRRRRYRRRRHRRLARRPCRRRSRSRPRARLPLRAQLRRHVDRGVLPAVEVFEAVETDDRRSVVAKKKKNAGRCMRAIALGERESVRAHACVCVAALWRLRRCWGAARACGGAAADRCGEAKMSRRRGPVWPAGDKEARRGGESVGAAARGAALPLSRPPSQPRTASKSPWPGLACAAREQRRQGRAGRRRARRRRSLRPCRQALRPPRPRRCSAPRPRASRAPASRRAAPRGGPRQAAACEWTRG